MADIDPMGLAIDWLDVCKKHDWKSLAALYAENVKATLPSESALPEGRILRGRREVAAYWKDVFEQRRGALFELVELYPGVDSVVLIYYDEQCRRVSEFLEFDSERLIVASARHTIPRQRQEAASGDTVDVSASPVRQAVLHCEARQTLHEARRLPVGPIRNNLRQRAVALLGLSKQAGSGRLRNVTVG